MTKYGNFLIDKILHELFENSEKNISDAIGELEFCFFFVFL